MSSAPPHDARRIREMGGVTITSIRFYWYFVILIWDQLFICFNYKSHPREGEDRERGFIGRSLTIKLIRVLYSKQILDQVEDDGYKGSCSSESGFSPIFVIAGVVLIGVILTVVFMLFGQSGRDGEQNNALVVPPGVVVDEAGAICETQDARFCHETPDIETWKDDGLP